MSDELWLEIFRHISQELTPKLWFKNTSLTCRTLCRISHPFLFSELDWRPYTIIDDFYSEPILATDVIDRALERLDPYDLLVALFTDIDCFTRLERIHAVHGYFYSDAVYLLSRLPSLTHLHIENCKLGDLEWFDTTPNLKVSSFVFKDNRAVPAPYHQEQWMRDTDLRWMELLDLGHLLELDARPCEPVFGTDLTVIPSFPLVHKLAMTTSSLSPACVRALYFCGEATVDNPAAQEIRASGLLPVLSEYAGSYHLLNLFLPRSSVTRLTIDFYRDLRSISPLPSITVLDVIFSASQTPSYICTQLFKYFPELRDLRMVNTTGISRKANENEVASDFLVTLLSARNVPASLTHLPISWDFSYQDDDNMPCPETPQFDLLCDALVAWCPALTTIWIDAPDFLFK
ncbi:hypothetical protein C8R44DRAFT_894963 [Mycena epipterygia]|nr:hypothetical protein C8R44DRAFT_894963 [Mycena epipterygia]